MKTFVKDHSKAIIGMIAVLLLLAVWVWFAGAARQQSSFRRTDERVAQAKEYVKSAFSGDRATRLKAIGSLAGMPQDGTCQGDWWNMWQQAVVPTIKDASEACQDTERKLRNVIRSASAVEQYTRDEAGIGKQLAALSVDTTAPDWPLRAKAAATRSAKAINSIRAISTVEPVQKAAKHQVGAIIAAWDALNSASSKQDKDAYLTAEAQLKQAYANLAAISDVSDAQLSKLLDRLQLAARAL